MSIKHANEMPTNVVGAGRDTTMQVLIGSDEGPYFAMRRFIIEPGGGMPLHTNEVEHEQYVLSGSARVQIGDDVHEVKAGDVVYIPGGVPHNYQAGDDGFEFLCVVPNDPDEIALVDC